MNNNIPLSELLRAQSLDQIVGQEHILSKDGIISRTIASKRPLSILLWGPPGTGKTSIARLYAQAFSLKFVNLSGVFSSTTEIKKIIKDSDSYSLFNRATLIFMDEIHRFNKAQQDAFLPYLENGTIVLVGATTQNPSFYLNNALLSRMRVLVLKPLEHADLEILLQRYEERYGSLPLSAEAREYLLDAAHGDGRYLFNLIETLRNISSMQKLEVENLKQQLPKHAPSYDRAGEHHYNLISALHKSIRTSDPDAALYWFARMLKGGEEPLFLARRLIRMASEDIGLADPQALSMAIAGRDSFSMLGSPEGELALAQVVVYLALAPKSNAVYEAYQQACTMAEQTAHRPPPVHTLNAPTKLMRKLDYSKGYIYDHDTALGCSGLDNFPEEIKRVGFYKPVERGFEREMKKRLEYFNAIRLKFVPKQN